jgi:hypothetical protein
MRNPFSSDFTNLWLPTCVSILGGLCLATLYVHHVAHQKVPGLVRIPQPSNTIRPVTVSSHDNCTNALGFLCPFGLPECAGESACHGRSFEY